MDQKIQNFTKQFHDTFREFLVNPDLPVIYKDYPETLERATVQNSSIVIPAREKFSDWDIFCYVDTNKVTLEVLNTMHDFVVTWPDFSIVEDYVTANPLHTNQPTYQSLGSEKLLCVQFMGIFSHENQSPLVDFHIYGIELSLLQNFYTNLCTPEYDGYLNWSMITLWRKLRRTGEINTEDSLYKKAVYAVLSESEQKQITENPTAFFNHHFANKPKYKEVVEFLNQDE